jgi:hypothetical protein
LAGKNSAGEDLDPARIWSEFSPQTSARGKLKLARVARTVARLLGEPRGVSHFRVAAALRQDINARIHEGIAMEKLDFALKKSRMGSI